jgi:hypothetical protein
MIISASETAFRMVRAGLKSSAAHIKCAASTLRPSRHADFAGRHAHVFREMKVLAERARCDAHAALLR